MKESLKDKVEKKIKKYFSIGYYDTENNRKIHEAFIYFCKKETDGNYLQGMKRLLEWYSVDWKYELLREEIYGIKKRVADMTDSQQMEQQETKKQPKTKTFGKGEKE